MDNRPDWDSVWLEMARVMAERSRCDRAKVGAVIVSADQRVLSSSYNGAPSGYPGEGSCKNWCPRAQKWPGDSLDPVYDDCHAAHAEANAIARADFTQMKGSSLYISTSMCKGCAKIAANSGIVRVVFLGTSDGSDDYRSPDVTVDFLTECGIVVQKVTQNDS